MPWRYTTPPPADPVMARVHVGYVPQLLGGQTRSQSRLLEVSIAGTTEGTPSHTTAAIAIGLRRWDTLAPGPYQAFGEPEDSAAPQSASLWFPTQTQSFEGRRLLRVSVAQHSQFQWRAHPSAPILLPATTTKGVGWLVDGGSVASDPAARWHIFKRWEE